MYIKVANVIIEHVAVHATIATAPTTFATKTEVSLPFATRTNALAMTPHTPHAPCTANASSGSSTSRYFNNLDVLNYNSEDTAPIPTLITGLAASHPAVIPTSPDKNPLHVLPTDCVPFIHYAKKKAVNPPTAQDIHVFTAAICMVTLFTPVAPSVDPLLNPNQPNHNIKLPSAITPELCGLNSSTLSGSNLPIRAPSTTAPTRPHVPPTRCTTPEPAKST